MAHSTTNSHPKTITGGCLCENIKYTITFPEEAKYPPDVNVCHCTMCRKHTGGLVAYFVTVSQSQVSWKIGGSQAPGEGNAQLKSLEFPSSPKCFRGFCPKCGSALSFRMEFFPDFIGVSAGTLDEDVLAGPEAANLTKPTTQYYCCRMIKGVTDMVSGGTKWVETPSKGDKME